MSNINAQAFLEGYMQKVAEEGPVTATPLSTEQMKKLGDKGQAAYNKAMEQDSLNKFLTSKNVQQYGTTAGGAALGGALGGMMGGDMASTIMGTALGGVVGWLAKYFFGDDINKAYQYALDKNAEGVLQKTVDALAPTKPESEKNKPTKEAVKESSAEIQGRTDEDTLKQSTGKEEGADAVDVAAAAARKLKAEQDRAKGQPPTAGITIPESVQNISLGQGQGPGYTEDEEMDLLVDEPVQQTTSADQTVEGPPPMPPASTQTPKFEIPTKFDPSMAGTPGKPTAS
jgi:hypothetical protein